MTLIHEGNLWGLFGLAGIAREKGMINVREVHRVEAVWLIVVAGKHVKLKTLV